MIHSDVIDWRVWKAASVAADVGPIEPGGTPIKKGDVIYVITRTTDSKQGGVSFITPGPVQLALHVAIRAAKDADAKRSALSWQKRDGQASPKWLDKENLPNLFAYFERSMVAVTFAFQCLESYANQIIVQQMEGTMKLRRSKGDVEWAASEIERNCSTEEKLSVVLPSLAGKKTPKGTKVWENFVKLKRTRDATIHLKDLDQYDTVTDDKQTLYYQFLNHSACEYPRRAIAMIRFFTPAGSDSWLVPAEDLLKS